MHSAGVARTRVAIVKDFILDDSLPESYSSGMTRVTGKFQITLPKQLVDAYGIRVGDELELVAAGDAIAILPSGSRGKSFSLEERLRSFDDATRRLSARSPAELPPSTGDRGWTRDELYTRGRSR